MRRRFPFTFLVSSFELPLSFADSFEVNNCKPLLLNDSVAERPSYHFSRTYREWLAVDAEILQFFPESYLLEQRAAVWLGERREVFEGRLASVKFDSDGKAIIGLAVVKMRSTEETTGTKDDQVTVIRNQNVVEILEFKWSDIHQFVINVNFDFILDRLPSGFVQNLFKDWLLQRKRLALLRDKMDEMNKRLRDHEQRERWQQESSARGGYWYEPGPGDPTR